MPERPEQTDKVQIGLTPKGAQDLEVVMQTGWFGNAMDAYRLAIAVALSNDVVSSPEDVVGSDTKYSFMGGIDRDGKVRALISALRPRETLPARFAERLGHAGLAILAGKLRDEDSLLSEAITPRAVPDNAP
jgi:hypothetical protein